MTKMGTSQSDLRVSSDPSAEKSQPRSCSVGTSCRRADPDQQASQPDNVWSL